MTAKRKLRISVFVLLWLLVFGYESLRYNYLNRWFQADLPKIMFLFPPAVWIMFYRVEDEGRARGGLGSRWRPALVD